MEFSLITREIFRQFVSCEYKAYAFSHLRDVGGDKPGSILTSRAERAKQTWMEMQHTDPSPCNS